MKPKRPEKKEHDVCCRTKQIANTMCTCGSFDANKMHDLHTEYLEKLREYMLEEFDNNFGHIEYGDHKELKSFISNSLKGE